MREGALRLRAFLAERKITVRALGRVHGCWGTWTQWQQEAKYHRVCRTCSALLAPGPTKTNPGHSASALATFLAANQHDNWVLSCWMKAQPTVPWASCRYCCPCKSSLSFSVFHSSLRVNSTSPSSAFLWIKSSKCCVPISSFFKTLHRHFCCSSQKILINLPAICWAAFSSCNSSRSYLTS